MRYSIRWFKCKLKPPKKLGRNHSSEHEMLRLNVILLQIFQQVKVESGNDQLDAVLFVVNWKVILN